MQSKMSKEWNCSSCTFLNKPSSASSMQRCEICLSQRPRNLLSPKRKPTQYPNNHDRKENVIDLNCDSGDGSAGSGSEDVMIVASTLSARKRKRNHSHIDSNGNGIRNDEQKLLVGNKKDSYENDEVTELKYNQSKAKAKGRKSKSKLKMTRKPKQGNNADANADAQADSAFHKKEKRRNDTWMETNTSNNSSSSWTNAKAKTCSNDELHSHDSTTKTHQLDYNELEKNSNFHSSSNSKVQSTLFGSAVPKIKPARSSPLEPEPNSRTKANTKSTAQNYNPPPLSTSIKSNANININTKASQHQSISEQTYQTLHTKSISILQTIFAIQSLRNLQPLAIESALRGQSQIIIMATGGGKSLCYQLPGVVLEGVTLVITPLIALMIDQVRQLKGKGILAELICSANSAKENQGVMERLKFMAGLVKGPKVSKEKVPKGQKAKEKETQKEQQKLQPVKLLYCTPELIQTDRFQSVLRALHKKKMLALVAIDEAHCMSTWGHDFRTSYRKLTWLRVEFPTVPIMACTATATKKVIQDIKDILLFGKTEKVHTSTFNRPNVCYEVRYKDAMGEHEAMLDLIKTIKQQHKKADKEGRPCSGIVYVHKRDDTTMISSQLQKAGVEAAPYHAGLKDGERKQIQLDWTMGKIKVAIATVAFGMGIDLAHVRYVLHWSMSKTLEGFYQESGRAGRDGLPSLSILYYSRDDASKFAFLIRKNLEKKDQQSKGNGGKKAKDKANDEHGMEALNKMIDYCTGKCCRRKYLLKHFGEEIDAKTVCKKTCDYCINPKKASEAYSKSSVSRAVRDVKRQNFRYNNYNNAKKVDGMGFKHDEDDGEYGHDDFYPSANMSDASGLGITHNPTVHAGFSTAGGTKLGTRGANSILSKYEAMECRTGTGKSTGTNRTQSASSGFVNFKANPPSKLKALREEEDDDEGYGRGGSYRGSLSFAINKSTAVTIPTHLLAQVQQAKSSTGSSTTNVTRIPEKNKTSHEISAAADLARAELEEIKERREALRAKFAKK